MKLTLLVLFWKCIYSEDNATYSSVNVPSVTTEKSNLGTSQNVSSVCGGSCIIECYFNISRMACFWTRNGAYKTILKRYNYTGDHKTGDCSIRIEEYNSTLDDGEWICWLNVPKHEGGEIPKKHFNVFCTEDDVIEDAFTPTHIDIKIIIISGCCGAAMLVSIVIFFFVRKHQRNMENTTDEITTQLPAPSRSDVPPPDVIISDVQITYTNEHVQPSSGSCDDETISEENPIYDDPSDCLPSTSNAVYSTVSPRAGRATKTKKSENRKARIADIELSSLDQAHQKKENDYSNT